MKSKKKRKKVEKEIVKDFNVVKNEVLKDSRQIKSAWEGFETNIRTDSIRIDQQFKGFGNQVVSAEKKVEHQVVQVAKVDSAVKSEWGKIKGWFS